MKSSIRKLMWSKSIPLLTIKNIKIHKIALKNMNLITKQIKIIYNLTINVKVQVPFANSLWMNQKPIIIKCRQEQ